MSEKITTPESINEQLARIRADVQQAKVNGNNGAGDVIPQADQEIDADREAEKLRLTDMGNAARFARQHAGDVLHVHQWGWLIWDGKRWARDETGAIMRAARRTATELYSEAQALEARANALIEQLQQAAEAGNEKLAKTIEERRKDLQARAAAVLKWALRSQAKSKLVAMVDLGESERALVARSEWFDRDPWLLNVNNGTLDLRTLELEPHDPGDRITKLAPVDWQPGATCPRWERFLQEVFCGDDELIRFVQRRVGYSLTGSVQEQEFALLYGLGANGKSTLVSVVLALMGDYATTTRAETLLEKRFGNAIPNDVAALAGARLVVASELPERATLNENLIKDLTGNDAITARFLRREFFTFQPQFKLWLYGNHKPRVKGTDDAIWRRVNLVEFNAQFTGDDADADLLNTLLSELPGILRWAVEGCTDWQRGGLRKPKAVESASMQYRTDQDALGAFITDACVTGLDYWSYTSNLYDAYKGWCEDAGEFALTKRRFGQRLRERGFVNERGGGNQQLYRGIGVLDQ